MTCTWSFNKALMVQPVWSDTMTTLLLERRHCAESVFEGSPYFAAIERKIDDLSSQLESYLNELRKLENSLQRSKVVSSERPTSQNQRIYELNSSASDEEDLELLILDCKARITKCSKELEEARVLDAKTVKPHAVRMVKYFAQMCPVQDTCANTNCRVESSSTNISDEPNVWLLSKAKWRQNSVQEALVVHVKHAGHTPKNL